MCIIKHAVVFILFCGSASIVRSDDICTETNLEPCVCPSGSEQTQSSNNVCVCKLCEAGKFQAQVTSEKCFSCTGKTKSDIVDIRYTDCVDSFITIGYDHKTCLPCPWTMNDVNYINIVHLKQVRTLQPYNDTMFYIDRQKCTMSSQPITTIYDFLSRRTECAAGESSENSRDVAKDTVCVRCPFGKFKSQSGRVGTCVNITESTRGTTDVCLSSLVVIGRREDTNCSNDLNIQQINARNYPILANGALFRHDQRRNSRILGNAKCINNTNSINCNPAGSCIDSFLYLWESEKVLLSETTCQKACSPGFVLIESKCQECGPGTSKNYSGNTACTECEAGKYKNVSKSITCLECPDSYFSKTKTL